MPKYQVFRQVAVFRLCLGCLNTRYLFRLGQKKVNIRAYLRWQEEHGRVTGVDAAVTSDQELFVVPENVLRALWRVGEGVRRPELVVGVGT